MSNREMNAKVARFVKESMQVISSQEAAMKKQALDRINLQTSVEKAVDGLIHSGWLPFEKKSAMVSDLTKHPEKMAKILEKLSKEISPSTLGKASSIMSHNDKLDPLAAMAVRYLNNGY